MRVLVLSFLLATTVKAQTGPVNPKPTNLDFSEGATGSVPSGWINTGNSVELRREGCPARSSACVLFHSPAVLEQSFPAALYIGQKVRFGAWLGMLGINPGAVEIRIRIDHADGRIEFFESPDGPVNSRGPQWREAVGGVSADAKFLSIQASFHPEGPAWISEPVFGVVNPSFGSTFDHDAIRTLMRNFTNARNAHDGNAVAKLYSEDGEWIGANGNSVKGRVALAALWGRVPGQVTRTIQSISFPGPNIAVVSVATEYEEPTGRHNETFVLVQEGAWRIRLHQSID